jgi:hypothetical protein
MATGEIQQRVDARRGRRANAPAEAGLEQAGEGGSRRDVVGLAAPLRRALAGIVVVEGHTVPNVEALALPMPEGGVLEGPAETAGAVGWREEDVRSGLVWICDRLADWSGEDSDRAQPWELDITVPGTTRLLNRFLPMGGQWLREWKPGGEESKWPDWGGLVLMAAARTAPRIFEGRLMDWWTLSRNRATPSEAGPPASSMA